MSELLRRLLLLVVIATGIAVVLVGWAGEIITVGTLDRTVAATVVGISLLVLSGLIAVLFEPIETDSEPS